MDTLPLLPLESENRAFPPTSRTLRATVATEDFGIACRVGQHVLDHRLLTSIHEHVERLEVSATVFGPRRVTADNPFLSPEQRNRLDDLGLIREGLVTKPGDVLISVLQVRKSLDLSRVLDNPRLQSVSDESIYVQPAWAGARVTQSEHVPQHELGPGAPRGVESLSIVRLVREHDLELGDLLAIDGQTAIVAGVFAAEEAPYSNAAQAADLILSAGAGRRLGMAPGEHQAIPVAKCALRAADALQVRSIGAYSLISQAPLGKVREAPQWVRAPHVNWLRLHGLTANLCELISLKSDDLVGRESIAAGLAGGAALGDIEIPAPAAPDSLALLVSWLQALGLNVPLEPADGCVQLSISPATTEELIARSQGVVAKPETINYRTYADEPGGLFCPKVFGPTDTRRRRRFGHIPLPTPIVPYLWRIGNPSLLETLLGLRLDEIERIVAYQADVFVRDSETRLENHDAAVGQKDLGPGWTPLQTGGPAIRRLLERVNPQRLPPMLRGRASALTPEVVLVAPPDLRPLVLLDSGNFATSDLNDHVRRVVNRRNRMLKLAELKAPQVILDNEMRMLQETVDSLFANALLPEGKAVGSDEGRPLKCTLSMLLGDVLEPSPKRVDWSGRARVLIQHDVPLGQALMPRALFDELQLDSSQPVLVTTDEGKGALVALLPQVITANVLSIGPQAAAALEIAQDALSEVVIHRPLGKAAKAEALRLLQAGAPSPQQHSPRADWLQARSAMELISGLVAAAMTGEPVRLDTPEMLLVGGTGSIEFAPDGAAKNSSFEPRLMEVPIPPTSDG